MNPSAYLDQDLKLLSQSSFKLIETELFLVEQEFERQARSRIDVISRVGHYLRISGGKRIRPALTLLSNYAAGGEGSSANAIRMATVMEFLHTATLVHDDIIDNADLRRNRPSINRHFGNQIAVLIGDWLYMSAFETSLAERSLEILDVLTAVTRKMTEGELLQLSFIGSTEMSEDEYFDVLRRKTAYLFAACCEIGAILVKAEPQVLNALRDYGLDLGTAFQLVDDILDFTGSEEVLGKPAGTDLLEGKLTLPLIYLLQDDNQIKTNILELMSEASYRNFPRSTLVKAAERNGSLERARSRAREFSRSACRALSAVPNSKFVDALLAITEFVLRRDR